MADALTRGREAYRRHAWEQAFTNLTSAVAEDGAAPDDLVMLARAAHLTGRDHECEEYLSRAHSRFLDDEEVEQAAECAFWLGFRLLHGGERARGGGWLARAQRTLDEAGVESGVRGLLLLPEALGSLGPDPDRALDLFSQAYEIGRRFDHADLLILSRLGRGQALIRAGRTTEGIRLLDEVMVDVTAGDASPMIVGIIYCGVIDACHELFDLRRAHEWTEAFTRWCASEPDVVSFRGECLIRRAEIMQVHGKWSDAMNEAERAGERLSQPPGQRAAGAAYYRQGEIHRLRGEFEEAERDYREAERWGRSPHPGFALLRIAQGQTDAAEAGIRKALEEATGRRTRSNLLPAFVEILLAVGDVEGARAGADELSEIAEALDSPYFDALAEVAEGSVLLEQGDCRKGLTTLRGALTTFREFGAAYEEARTLVQIARACRGLGDDEACETELEEARSLFERLKAQPDLERLGVPTGEEQAPGGLTPRELEVLGLVATGMTNRAIADKLYISEKTVARHLSNIFNKLGISSRAAATAFAYEHDLVST